MQISQLLSFRTFGIYAYANKVIQLFKALFRVDINHTYNTSSNELLKSTKVILFKGLNSI